MQMNLMKKCLSLGIVFLFIGIATAPSTTAHNNAIFPNASTNSDKEITLVVREYKPDGTIEKTFVKMPRGQYEDLRGELSGVFDVETQLSIYKKYHVVPQNITSKTLREGMEEKSLRLGVSEETLEKTLVKNILLKRYPWGTVSTIRNSHCEVIADFIGSISLFFGLSPLTNNINFFTGVLLDRLFNITFAFKSTDFLDLSLAFGGVLVTTHGDAPDNAWYGFGAHLVIIGFVGFVVCIYPIIPIKEAQGIVGLAYYAVGGGVDFQYPPWR